MLHTRVSLILALFLIGCGGAAATGPGGGGGGGSGELVLANYRGSGAWFAGRVAGRSGDSVTIAYLDGDRETVSANSVKPFDWQVGTRVDCNWKRKGKFYPGQITSMNGQNVHIAYDDGDQEDTTIALCRSR